MDFPQETIFKKDMNPKTEEKENITFHFYRTEVLNARGF